MDGLELLLLPKGFEYFNDLALFKKEYPDQFEALVVGRHGIQIEDYPCLNFIAKANSFMERDEFDIAVSQLDFIVFFLYKWTL